jgi:hypothetical protein
LRITVVSPAVSVAPSVPFPISIAAAITAPTATITTPTATFAPSTVVSALPFLGRSGSLETLD